MTEMEGFRSIVARHCIFVLQNVDDEEVVMDSFSREVKGTYKNYSPTILGISFQQRLAQRCYEKCNCTSVRLHASLG